MKPEWFYICDGRPCGPIALSELVDLARIGKIGPADLVRWELDPEWCAASAIEGLAPESVVPDVYSAGSGDGPNTQTSAAQSAAGGEALASPEPQGRSWTGRIVMAVVCFVAMAAWRAVLYSRPAQRNRIATEVLKGLSALPTTPKPTRTSPTSSAIGLPLNFQPVNGRDDRGTALRSIVLGGPNGHERGTARERGSGQ